MTEIPRSPLDLVGFVLVRAVVPLWVLAGAVFKLVEGTSKNLPQSIIAVARDLSLNLDWLLATLIALEFIAAGIMIFVGRWARAMAVAMLSMFCLILIAEVSRGAESCGCFGSVKIAPAWMLAIDGTLLLGCVVIGRGLLPSPESGAARRRFGAFAAAAWALAALALSFSTMASWHSAAEAPENGGVVHNDSTNNIAAQPNGNATASTSTSRVVQPLPPFYLTEYSSWIGKTWAELDIAQFMKTWPADIDSGKRYVVLYSATCEHCHELLEMYFTGELAIPTTAIRIPEKRDGFAKVGTLPMPCSDCELLELPVGCDWVINPPVLVALEDGKVICVKEGEEILEPECLIWGPAGQ